MEDLTLGGNIVLSGFRDLDGGSIVILKKIVGNYARKFSDRTEMQQLHLTMKPIHEAEETGKPQKFEIKAKLVCAGDIAVAERTDFNVFVAVDSALKSIENSLGK